LRFKVGGKVLPLESTLNLMQHPRGEQRKAASQALAKTFKGNLRVFTQITNTLAKDKEIADRWRGFEDIADAAISPIGSRRSGRCAGGFGARRLSTAVTPLLRAQGRWFGKSACRIGTATRRFRK